MTLVRPPIAPARLVIRGARVLDPREAIDGALDLVVVDGRLVELAAEVIDSPQAVIGQQVEAGVIVRMAVLYELLAGRQAPRPTLATAPVPA